MISIIICSVNEKLAKRASENLSSTVGVDHEIIIFDNKDLKWGICKVYNYCAEQSKYRYLCFLHEDMFIYTQNWGEILVNCTVINKTCGVIGLAGTNYVPLNFVEWKIDKYFSRVSTTLSGKNKDSLRNFVNIKNTFDEVVILDGMFLFTSKSIWNKYKFDELNYKGFHLYDSDFTFNVAQEYRNYVCGIIKNTHFCHSKLNGSYCSDLLLFRNKWKQHLTNGKFQPNLLYKSWIELFLIKQTILLYLKNNYTRIDIWKIITSRNSGILLMFLPLSIIFSRVISFFTNIKIRSINAESYIQDMTTKTSK